MYFTRLRDKIKDQNKEIFQLRNCKLVIKFWNEHLSIPKIFEALNTLSIKFIEREIGEETILTEASDLAIREDYRKAIIENKIDVISQPQVAIKKIARGDSLIFTVTVAVFPEIKLPDYKNIASKSKRTKITVAEMN